MANFTGNLDTRTEVTIMPGDNESAEIQIERIRGAVNAIADAMFVQADVCARLAAEFSDARTAKDRDSGASARRQLQPWLNAEVAIRARSRELPAGDFARGYRRIADRLTEIVSHHAAAYPPPE